MKLLLNTRELSTWCINTSVDYSLIQISEQFSNLKLIAFYKMKVHFPKGPEEVDLIKRAVKGVKVECVTANQKKQYRQWYQIGDDGRLHWKEALMDGKENSLVLTMKQCDRLLKLYHDEKNHPGREVSQSIFIKFALPCRLLGFVSKVW